METLQRKLFYKDSDFGLWYTPYGDRANVHCQVYRWAPSSLKHGIRVFAELQNMLKTENIKYLLTVNDNPKFSKLLGARVFGYTTVEGKEYEVLGWELK